MKKEVFRQSAIDHVSTPDRLDEILTVTQPRDWLTLLSIGVLIGAAAIWGLQGRIFKKIPGQGLLMLERGIVEVAAEGSGRVRELRVKTGDLVQVDQVVASLSQPSMGDKIKALRESLAELQSERNRSGSARAEGLRLQKTANQNQRETMVREIGDFREQGKLLGEQIKVEEELLSKGLITRQQMLATRQKLVGIESSIAKIEAQMKQLEVGQFQAEAGVTQADKENEARVSELQRSIALLESELGNVSLARSRHAGRVIEVKVYPGALVGAGEPLISVEPLAERVEAIVYVTSARVKEVQPGMAVEISPGSVQREEYGFMRGKVASVAQFPATRAAILRNFANDALVADLASRGPVNEVRVELERDSGTTTGFKWSSSKGPAMPITTGTLATASIITREQNPISVVVPFLKQNAGMK